MLTVVSFFAKNDIGSGVDDGSLRWGLLTFVFVTLFIIWWGVWFLDIFYYNRLLTGAAKAVVDLEKSTMAKDLKPADTIYEINMSYHIEQAVRGKYDKEFPLPLWSGRRWFYISVFSALGAGSVISFIQYAIEKDFLPF